MTLALIGQMLLYIVVVGFTPGPANIYALSCGLQHGRKHSMVMWLGLVAGFTITVTIAAVTSYFVGEAMGDYVSYIKYLGAAYIAWLGLGMIRDASRELEEQRTRCTFTNGLIMQLTNAKMIMFAYTIFGTFILPLPSPTVPHFIITTLLLYIAGPVANLAWLSMGSGLRRFLTGNHRTRYIVMGTALILCALMLLFT